MIRGLSMQEITLIEEIWRVIVEKYFTVDYGIYENINIDANAAISPAIIVFAVVIAAVTATAVMIFNKGTLGRLIRRLLMRGGVGHENAKTLEELGLDKSRAIKLFINKYTLLRYVRCREEDEFYGIDPSECDEEIKSIGLENNEVIKVPFWRRKSDAQMRADACATRENEEKNDVASIVDAATHCDECDAEKISNAAQENDECDEGGEYALEDSYAASLVAEKRYKRKPTDHFYIRPSQKHRLAILFDKKGTHPIWIFIIGAVCLIGGALVVKVLPWILSTLDGLLGAFNTNGKY